MDEQIQRVLEKLTDMAITYRVVQHPPVYTIEEMEALGIQNMGAVSPFGIWNDTDCRVEVAIDEDLARLGEIAVPPNRNTATVWMNPNDLIELIRAHGNALTTIRIRQ